MHEILRAVHEVYPIPAVAIVRKSTVVGSKTKKSAHVEILFGEPKNRMDSPVPEGFLKSVGEKLAKRGYKVTPGNIAPIDMSVSSKTATYRIRLLSQFAPKKATITIESTSGTIGTREERRLKRIAASLTSQPT